MKANEARERLEQLARRTIGCISRSCHDTAVTDAILATIDALEALGFVRKERLEVAEGLLAKCGGFISSLRDDTGLVVTLATQAQRICDEIRDVLTDPEAAP